MEGNGEIPVAPEPKIKKDIVISGSILYAAINKPIFKSQVRKAISTLGRTEHDMEIGFDLFLNPKTKGLSHITKSVIGDEYVEHTPEESAQRQELIDQGRFQLIDAHTHPYGMENPISSYVPSEHDLRALVVGRDVSRFSSGVDGYPIGCIIVPTLGRTDLVLYQQNPENQRSPQFDDYLNDYVTVTSFSELTDLLQQTGFKSLIVRDYPDGLTPEDMDRFAFSISPLK